MESALDTQQTKRLALEAGFDLVGVLDPALVIRSSGASHAASGAGAGRMPSASNGVTNGQGNVTLSGGPAAELPLLDYCDGPHREQGPEAIARAPAWVRGVLVVAYATLDEAYDYNVYVEVRGQRRWSKLAYEVLVARAARLALALRDRGARADPLTFEDSAAIIDLRRAAIAVGLGMRGKNELVITRDFGPRVRLGAVFTDLDLEPDRPLSEYFCSSCTRCWSACPTGALGPLGLDRVRCLGDFAPGPEMLARQKRELRRLSPCARLQCVACLTACPIGARLATTYWDGE